MAILSKPNHFLNSASQYPLQTQLVRQAATKAGAALDTAYNRKMIQAGEACRREGMVFVPMPW
jgi:hypothetical protein